MGLTDEHIEVLRLALAHKGLIPVKIGDPLLEGMTSMGLLVRAGIVNGGRRQFYLVTKAGEGAYARLALP